MSTTDDYIEDAKSILIALGFPPAQQNERSALCLLALLNLTPGKPWVDAEAPMMGITPIMGWVREHYGKEYAPNTRKRSDGRPCTSSVTPVSLFTIRTS